jgi:photosystem II stability/assembly factor-like uncharacterized protein
MWGMAIDNAGSIVDAFTRSTNGGNTWEAGTFNAGNGLSQIFAFDADVCWAVFNTGSTQGLYKTEDGGVTWVKKGGVYGAGSFANVIHFFNDTDGFAQGDPVGGEYELYVTADGGETWTPVDGANIPDPTPDEYGITGNYCAVGDYIWWGTNQGRIFRSDDKGYTWDVSMTAFGAAETVSSIMFDELNGFAFRSYLNMGIEEILNETNDGGVTWTEFNTFGAAYARYFYIVPGTTNTVIGSAMEAPDDMGISISEDGGHTWTEISSGYAFQASAWLDLETGWCGTFSTGSGTDGMYIYGEGPTLAPPTNLEYTVDYNDVTLTWEEPGFSDDFESYDDFVLEFSPWTCIDVDGSTTYGMTGTTWPNAFDPQAYIIFNPLTTVPPVADMTAHSGDKFAACLASTTPDNELSFWVKTYVDTYGLERYKVGISTTGTNPSDFTIVSGTGYLEAPADDWEEYTYDLSSYVGDDIYIGIECVSSDAFVFMVDDFSVGSTKANIAFNTNTGITGTAVKDISSSAIPGKPYTVYGGPSSAKSVLEGYNVYRNDDILDYVAAPTTEYLDVDVPIGVHIYYITAVYDEGESDPSNTVTVDIITNVAEFDADQMVIYPNPATNMVNIESESDIISLVLYTYLGQVVTTLEPGMNKAVLDVSNRNPGIYFVRLETEKGVVTKKITIE